MPQYTISRRGVFGLRQEIFSNLDEVSRLPTSINDLVFDFAWGNPVVYIGQLLFVTRADFSQYYDCVEDIGFLYDFLCDNYEASIDVIQTILGHFTNEVDDSFRQIVFDLWQCVETTGRNIEEFFKEFLLIDEDFYDEILKPRLEVGYSSEPESESESKSDS